jgi:hypothetical protein
MSCGYDNPLAEIDAVASELVSEWRSFDDVNCVYSQRIVGGLRLHRCRYMACQYEDETEQRG